MAHDDSEQYRVSALKMLNELSPDMGQLICESYIVPEIKSLAIDEQSIVRVTVARNLLNVSKNVSLDYFSQQIFPLYKMLTKDDEERVRKTCADVVADIANVSPLDRNAQELQDVYFNFLKDPKSRIVRGTAFQNVGPFIAAFKDVCAIDQRITDFYLTTTEATNNKDVCYYASFNFPAFIYVHGRDHWDTYKKVYFKLAKVNDLQTKRTLACSIHELARILGPDITERDLLPIFEKFLEGNLNEIRVGALKNMHVFLAEVNPEKRAKFINAILKTYNDA